MTVQGMAFMDRMTAGLADRFVAIMPMETDLAQSQSTSWIKACAKRPKA